MFNSSYSEHKVKSIFHNARQSRVVESSSSEIVCVEFIPSSDLTVPPSVESLSSFDPDLSSGVSRSSEVVPVPSSPVSPVSPAGPVVVRDCPVRPSSSVPSSPLKFDGFDGFDDFDPDQVTVTAASPLGAFISPSEPKCAWDTMRLVDQFGYEIRHEHQLLRMLYAYMRSSAYRAWFTATYGDIPGAFVLTNTACFETRYCDPATGQKARNLLYGKVQSRKTDQIVSLFFWAYRIGNFVPVGLLHDSGKDAQISRWQEGFNAILHTAQELSRLRFGVVSPALVAKFSTTILTRTPVGGSAKQAFPPVTNLSGGFVVADLCLVQGVAALRTFLVRHFRGRPLFTVHDETDEVQATYKANSTEREKLLSFFATGGLVTDISATHYATQTSFEDPLLYKVVMSPPANYRDLIRDVTFVETGAIAGPGLAKFAAPLQVLFDKIRAENGAYTHKNVLVNCTTGTESLNTLVGTCAQIASAFTPFVAFSFHSARIVVAFPRVEGAAEAVRCAFKRHLAEEVEAGAVCSFSTTIPSTFQVAYDGALALFAALWPGQPPVTICVAGKMADRCNTMKPTNNRYFTANVVTASQICFTGRPSPRAST